MTRPLTAEEVLQVQQSWARLRPSQATAAGLFYGRLFELDPGLRALFRHDLEAQGAKLMSALNVVVMSLGRVADVLPVLQLLARRHVGYGVQPAHYRTVGQALLWTLQQGLGEAFTPALRQAWAAAYGTVAGAMLAAAEDPTGPEAGATPATLA